jgi:disulfide bond formation protein DsbB
MAVQDYATITATLALLANAATFLLVAGLLVGDRLPVLDRLTWWVRDHAFVLGAGVALAATVGSLIYSEIYDFIPCRYCWFQRIAMYPIVVVLGVAAWAREESARLTAGILATAGFGVATWHWLIQQKPEWASESSCNPFAPCSTPYVEEFGFVTIPWMAGSGFLLIIVLLVSGAVLRDPTPESTQEVVGS